MSSFYMTEKVRDAIGAIAERHVLTKPAWMDSLVRMPDRLAASIALGAAFAAASPAERADVCAGWNFGVDWEFPSPWRLACVTGESGSPQERIVASLILNALGNSSDSREEILLYGVPYNACALAGLDGDALLLRVAATLPGRAAKSLRAFVARAPKDKALGAFRLVTSAVSLGEVEIRPNW
jgi:hypothetical protein